MWAACDVLVHDGEFKNMHNFIAFSLKLYFLYCMESFDCFSSNKKNHCVDLEKNGTNIGVFFFFFFFCNHKKLNHINSVSPQYARGKSFIARKPEDHPVTFFTI